MNTVANTLSSHLLILLACAILAQPFAAIAQANVPASLPPVAQEALNKGIIAAKMPDYLLAIRFFEEARKIAPQAPVIYLNMGLAESKNPGRELRAIAWFGAYLAAYPNAPNAAAVKEQIAVLDVRSQSNLSRLIKSVQDAASQLSGETKNSNLRYVAELLAKAGDISAALKTVDLIQDKSGETYYKSWALLSIAETQAKKGEIAGAQKTADRIGDYHNKSSALIKISIVQAEAGNIAGALQTADLILDKPDKTVYKSRAQSDITKAQAQSGDITGALKTADGIRSALFKCWAQTSIAEAQIKARDSAGAQKTLATALRTAGLIQQATSKCEAQWAIAEAQVKAGDSAGARSTLVEAQKSADQIQEPGEKSYEQRKIAEVQAKARNVSSTTSPATTGTHPPIPPVIAGSDWLMKLDDDNKSNGCPLNTEPFLDLVGYLKSLPPAENPQAVFKSLHETAEKIIGAQNVIHQMLKQEAKK